MVFFFVAGPLGVFGGFGDHPIQVGRGVRNRDSSELRSTFVFSTMLIMMTVLLSGSFPFYVPLLTVFVHFFPEQFDRVRNWFTTNRYGLLYLVLVFIVIFYMGNDSSEYFPPVEIRSREEQEAEARAQRMHQRRQQQQRQQHQRGGVDGFDGSYGGSVFFDFAFTVLLMAITFLLPQMWSLLNGWMLRYLPDSGRRRWRHWTEFVRPTSQPPGSVPASEQAVRKLEDLVIEERHLIMEGQPGGILCPVCLEHMKIRECVKRLPCKHLFHPSCVLPWLEKHNSCPTCRFELETADPEYEFQRQERQREQEREEALRRGRQQQRARVQHQQRTNGTATVHHTSAEDGVQTLTRDAEVRRLMRLSVLELKAVARQRNINTVGCVEKRELCERILNGGLI